MDEWWEFEEDEGESTRSWRSFILGLLLGSWLTSLLSNGFVDIAYWFGVTINSMPYLLVAVNLLATLMVFYIIALIHKRYGFWFPTGFMDATLVPLVIATFPAAGVAWLLVFGLAALALDLDVGPRASVMGLLGLVLLIMIAVYSPIAASRNIEASYLEDPINVYGVNRVVPLYTAYKYASDRIQIPTHAVYQDESYIYYENGTPVYNWVVDPEGFWNRYTRKPVGAIFIKGNRMPVDVLFVEHEMEWGLRNRRFKVFFIDSLERQIKMRVLGAQIFMDEAVELYRQGRLWIVVPVIKWDRGALWSLSKPYALAVVSEEGEVEVISVKEALGDPRLDGVPLVPERVAREWAEKYAYIVGFVEYYFKHNKYEIRDVGDNPQPYLLIDDNGTLWWVFIVEPAGETYSAKYVIYVKAREDFKPTLRLWRPDKLLIGVSKVLSYVKQAHPNYDWDQVQAVEPMPTIVNGTAFWKVTVVTSDYRGLVSVEIVNASAGTVTSFPANIGIDSEFILEKALSHKIKTEINETKTYEDVIVHLQKKIDELIQELQKLKKELEALREAYNITR